jgi:hypothetical protein
VSSPWLHRSMWARRRPRTSKLTLTTLLATISYAQVDCGACLGVGCAPELLRFRLCGCCGPLIPERQRG